VPLGSNFAIDPEILLQFMPATFTSISMPMRVSRLVMIKGDSIGKLERSGFYNRVSRVEVHEDYLIFRCDRFSFNCFYTGFVDRNYYVSETRP
jgi:hypothetical protein